MCIKRYLFVAEECDGVGDKVSGDTTVNVHTHFEALLNMLLRICLLHS